MWDYSDKVKDHYLNPRNVGEINDPDGVGEVGNITCGDALRLTFKLDENNKIADIKFKTFGCGSAIASASMLTELVKGKTVEEAEKITNRDIADALEGLPKQKMHCSVMGQEALEKAISFYKTGGKVEPDKDKHGAIVCTCFNVTEEEIRKAITENNLKTVDDVTDYTKAGGGCGGCHPRIQEILDDMSGAPQPTTESPKPKRLTTVEKIDLIRKTIQEEINPILEADGGGCELIDVDGNEVFVKMQGHCSGCAFSQMTVNSVVEKKLKEKVSDQLVIRTE